MKVNIFLIIKLASIKLAYCQISTGGFNLPFDNLAGTYLQGFAIFGGGQHNGITSNVVQYYSTQKNQVYNTYLSQARYGLTATSLNNLALFAGGQDSSNYYSTVDIFSGTNILTSTVTSLSSPRSYLTAASLSNLAFFAGGVNSNGVSNVVDIFNGTVWYTKQLSNPRMKLASASLPNYKLVFFAGGTDGTNSFATVDIYDDNSKTWLISQLSAPRSELAAAALTSLGLVYFAGGINGNPSNVIDIYNANLKTWSLAKLSVARNGVQTGVIENKVYFAGGFSNVIEKVIDIIDASANQTYKSEMSIERTNFAGVSIPDYKLIIFAGVPDSTEVVSGQVSVLNKCQAGYSSNILSTSYSCSICTAGNYAFMGNLNCSTCPAGSYCPTNGQQQPVPSPAGYYVPNPGSTSYSQSCTAGFYCPMGSIGPQDCPPGYYCNRTLMDAPFPCSGGYYNLRSRMTSKTACIACPTGSYCPEGSPSSIPCKNGYYCPDLASQEVLCPAGFYCPYGAHIPQICGINTFSDAGSPACSSCGSGTYTLTQGSAYCTTCFFSDFKASNWHCMSNQDRTLFIVIIILIIIVSILILYSIYKIRRRIFKLRKNKSEINFKNFFFLEIPREDNKKVLISRPNSSSDLKTPSVIEPVVIDNPFEENEEPTFTSSLSKRMNLFNRKN